VSRREAPVARRSDAALQLFADQLEDAVVDPLLAVSVSDDEEGCQCHGVARSELHARALAVRLVGPDDLVDAGP
jgi:hypothetical protein